MSDKNNNELTVTEGFAVLAKELIFIGYFQRTIQVQRQAYQQL